MAIIFNKAALAHAKYLIEHSQVVHDDRKAYSEVIIDRDDMVRYINTHSIQEYGKWFLGIDTEKPQDHLDRYVLPYGDFNVVHRSILLELEEQVSKNGHHEILQAVRELLELTKKK